MGTVPVPRPHAGLEHQWDAALGPLPVRADRGHAGSLQLNCCGSNTLTSLTTSIFKNNLCPSGSTVIGNFLKVRWGGSLPAPHPSVRPCGSRVPGGGRAAQGPGSTREGRGHTEFCGLRRGALPRAEFHYWPMGMASLCPAPTGELRAGSQWAWRAASGSAAVLCGPVMGGGGRPALPPFACVLKRM